MGRATPDGSRPDAVPSNPGRDPRRAPLETIRPPSHRPCIGGPAAGSGAGVRRQAPARGDAGRRETTCCVVKPVSRRPRNPVPATPDPNPRSRHGVCPGPCDSAGVLKRHAPSRRGRPAVDSGPKTPCPPRSGRTGRGSGDVPASRCGASRPDRDTLRRRRRPGRWRNRAIDAGAVSSPQAHRPGPPTGLPRGGRVAGVVAENRNFVKGLCDG